MTETTRWGEAPASARAGQGVRGVVGAAGQVWLRGGVPDSMSGLCFDVCEPWPLEAGRICDLATAPLALGQEMVSQAAHIPGFSLGPVFADAEQVVFCLELGAADRLRDPRHVGWHPVPPGTIRAFRAGEVCVTPPPVTWRPSPGSARGAAGAAVWLVPPNGARALPRAGRFAYLVGAAASTLELAAAAWRRPPPRT